MPSVHLFCAISGAPPLTPCAQQGAPFRINRGHSRDPIRLPTEARFCLQSATPPTLPSSFVAICVQGSNVQKPDLFWFLTLLFPRVHAERKLIAVRHTHGSKQTNNQQTNENYFLEMEMTVNDIMVHIPFMTFRESSSVPANRLPLRLVWLWGEIYGPVKLLNEQINRFVFDIVCCI